ncbi:MAG: hypothetical protein SFT92_08700 [Rickettsiales bacterium]|nr:hypothetical protein [Rickettsiales bacterium]
MIGKRLLVAVLLLTCLGQVAVAAAAERDDVFLNTPVAKRALYEPPKTAKKMKSEKTQKALIVLGAIGINSTDALDFIQMIDDNIEDGYFWIAERPLGGGSLMLRYQLDKKSDIYSYKDKRQIELRYVPENSNFQAYARPDRVVIEYKLKF